MSKVNNDLETIVISDESPRRKRRWNGPKVPTLLLALVVLFAAVLAGCGWASDATECATSSASPAGTNTRVEKSSTLTTNQTFSVPSNVTWDGQPSSGGGGYWSITGNDTPAAAAVVTLTGSGTHSCLAHTFVTPVSGGDSTPGVDVRQTNFNLIGDTIFGAEHNPAVQQEGGQLGIYQTKLSAFANSVNGTSACVQWLSGDNMTFNQSYCVGGDAGIIGTWGSGTDQGIRVIGTSNSPSGIWTQHGPWFSIGSTKIADLNYTNLITSLDGTEAAFRDAAGAYMPPSGIVAGHCDHITLFGPVDGAAYSLRSATVSAWQSVCTNVVVATVQGAGPFHAGTNYGGQLY